MMKASFQKTAWHASQIHALTHLHAVFWIPLRHSLWVDEACSHLRQLATSYGYTPVVCEHESEVISLANQSSLLEQRWFCDLSIQTHPSSEIIQYDQCPKPHVCLMVRAPPKLKPIGCCIETGQPSFAYLKQWVERKIGAFHQGPQTRELVQMLLQTYGSNIIHLRNMIHILENFSISHDDSFQFISDFLIAQTSSDPKILIDHILSGQWNMHHHPYTSSAIEPGYMIWALAHTCKLLAQRKESWFASRYWNHALKRPPHVWWACLIHVLDLERCMRAKTFDLDDRIRHLMARMTSIDHSNFIDTE